MIKILKILLDYQNINTFFKRLHSKLVRRSFFWFKVKNTLPWTYVISDLNGEEIVGTFYEKREKQFKKSLELKT